MAQFDLNRSNDTPIPTLLLNQIEPIDWRRFPPPVEDMDPANANIGRPTYDSMTDWYGGLFGDDVSVAAASQSIGNRSGGADEDPYAPVNQAHRAEIMVPPTSLAVDVTWPRGWIGPLDPYGPPPTPAVTSIDPASHEVGPGAPFILTVTGTNFLPGSVILFGNNTLGERTTFVSETTLTTIVQPDLFPNPDPAVKVRVRTGGVESNSVDFEFTAPSP
jgi:hypothetical protein